MRGTASEPGLITYLCWELALVRVFRSTLIDYHQAWAKREETLDDSQEIFAQVQIRRERIKVTEMTRRLLTISEDDSNLSEDCRKSSEVLRRFSNVIGRSANIFHMIPHK